MLDITCLFAGFVGQHAANGTLPLCFIACLHERFCTRSLRALDVKRCDTEIHILLLGLSPLKALQIHVSDPWNANFAVRCFPPGCDIQHVVSLALVVSELILKLMPKSLILQISALQTNGVSLPF